MATAEMKVSHRGQMSLPAATRHRWHLSEGGTVHVADLGDALLIVPATDGGLRAALRRAVDEAGGYAVLVADVTADEPELA